MSTFCGSEPSTNEFFKNFSFRSAIVAFVARSLLGFLMTASVLAQQDVPLTLAEAERIALDQEPERIALDQEPGQAAFLARAEAFEEESIAAGELPDPSLRMAIANYPLESGGFTTEGMTQAQLGIRQAFPPGDALAASTRRFESLAREMRESADGRSRDVLTAVRDAWLETYYWQRAHAIVNESRPFFDDLVTVTRSMYSVGRKNQQDLLRAELELSRIDDRLIDINQRHARAIAVFSQWVGDNARRPIAEKPPQWAQVPALELMQSSVLVHPAMKAAEARISARQAGVDFAEAKLKQPVSDNGSAVFSKESPGPKAGGCPE
jgi:outer membrane protein TolC